MNAAETIKRLSGYTPKDQRIRKEAKYTGFADHNIPLAALIHPYGEMASGRLAAQMDATGKSEDVPTSVRWPVLTRVLGTVGGTLAGSVGGAALGGERGLIAGGVGGGLLGYLFTGFMQAKAIRDVEKQLNAPIRINKANLREMAENRSPLFAGVEGFLSPYYSGMYANEANAMADKETPNRDFATGAGVASLLGKGLTGLPVDQLAGAVYAGSAQNDLRNKLGVMHKKAAKSAVVPEYTLGEDFMTVLDKDHAIERQKLDEAMLLNARRLHQVVPKLKEASARADERVGWTTMGAFGGTALGYLIAQVMARSNPGAQVAGALGGGVVGGAAGHALGGLLHRAPLVEAEQYLRDNPTVEKKLVGHSPAYIDPLTGQPTVTTMTYANDRGKMPSKSVLNKILKEHRQILDRSGL